MKKGEVNKGLSINIRKYYKLEKIKYKSVTIINSLEEYIDFLSKYIVQPMENGGKAPQYVFRGISNASQKYSKITNKIYTRAIAKPYLDSKRFGNSLNNELSYIRKFEQNAPSLSSEYHNALDLVATAQHNSLRTRLIDWTRSPLIATLFALHSSPKKKVAREKGWCGYYLILVANMKEHILARGLPLSDRNSKEFGQLSNYLLYGEMLKYLTQINDDYDKVDEYFEKLLLFTNTKYMLADEGVSISQGNKTSTLKSIVQKFKQGKIFFLETNFSNSRITNQRGLFQLSVDPYKSYIDSTYKDLDLVFISQKARGKILEFCEKLGVNFYALVPELQSVAEEINRKEDEKERK